MESLRQGLGPAAPTYPLYQKKVVSEQAAQQPTIETGLVCEVGIWKQSESNEGAVKLKTWQLLFYVPNLNWYQRQSFNLVCIANKPHHFEGQIEAKTCHENHSIF